MSKPRIHIRGAIDGDWEALYVDGKKVEETHTISMRKALQALGVEFTSEEVEAEPYGESFPETL